MWNFTGGTFDTGNVSLCPCGLVESVELWEYTALLVCGWWGWLPRSIFMRTRFSKIALGWTVFLSFICVFRFVSLTNISYFTYNWNIVVFDGFFILVMCVNILITSKVSLITDGI
jgi:hypothetical protein